MPGLTFGCGGFTCAGALVICLSCGRRAANENPKFAILAALIDGAAAKASNPKDAKSTTPSIIFFVFIVLRLHYYGLAGVINGKTLHTFYGLILSYYRVPSMVGGHSQ